MLEVVFEKLELEAIGKPIDGPGYRVRLIAAHHQATDFLFPIRETIWIAQRRQVRHHTGD
jgi:hypothetical protein